MTIGEKIYKIRSELSLSQKDFATKIGSSQSSVNYWENGKRTPKFKQIARLCSALDIDLLGFLDEKYEFDDNDKVYHELHETETNYRESVQRALKKYIETGIIEPVLSDYDISQYYEECLLQKLKKLNHHGEAEALKRITELSQLPDYVN
ncbi:MAG: helix-turn-helix domain-containing protein [Lachnospiraceae bacterium]|nr:helix-turn-helix domain-containing protein [Lachnospiraceae bacterium]